MRLLTKWATADVPVRVRSRVVAVPVERARVRAVVHVTTRDDHRSRVPLSPMQFTSYFLIQNFMREGSRHVVVTFPLPEAPGERIPRSPLKWSLSSLRATAEVPGRDRSRVEAVPAERARERAVGHATTRDDHFSAFGGLIIIAEVCVT